MAYLKSLNLNIFVFALSKFSQLLAKFCLSHPVWFEGFFWVLVWGFFAVCLTVLEQAASPPDLVMLPKLLISPKGEDRVSLFPAQLREEREHVIACVCSPARLQGLPFAYCGI